MGAGFGCVCNWLFVPHKGFRVLRYSDSSHPVSGVTLSLCHLVTYQKICAIGAICVNNNPLFIDSILCIPNLFRIKDWILSLRSRMTRGVWRWATKGMGLGDGEMALLSQQTGSLTCVRDDAWVLALAVFVTGFSCHTKVLGFYVIAHLVSGVTLSLCHLVTYQKICAIGAICVNKICVNNNPFLSIQSSASPVY